MPSDPDEPSGLARISIGAGVAVLNLAGFGLGGGFALSDQSQQPIPGGTALVEVALSRRFRAVFGVNGSYRRSESTSFQPAAGAASDSDLTLDRQPSTTKAWGQGFRAGLRWVVNPGGIVEVSPLLSVGWNRYRREERHQDDGSSNGDSNQKGQAIDVQVGLVLERELIKHLYLRFESSVLQYTTKTRAPTPCLQTLPLSETARIRFLVSRFLPRSSFV